MEAYLVPMLTSFLEHMSQSGTRERGATALETVSVPITGEGPFSNLGRPMTASRFPIVFDRQE
jgi:hypothetical protein